MPLPNPPMSPDDGRRLARQRLWARKQRTRGIRRRVAAITLALFAALWVAIFVHLATGHDPALGASSRPAKAPSQASTSDTSTTAAQAASSPSSAGGSATDTSSSGSDSSGSSSPGSSSGSSSSAAPVTTSQS